jgi:hypothetical protein
MRETTRGVIRYGAIWTAVAAALAADLSALAQLPSPPVDPNERQVFLVRTDQSDCTNSDVPNVESPSVFGNVVVNRLDDGNTSVSVGITAKPNTTYHFSLKCVRALGDLATGDEGVATAMLTFPTSLVGAVYAFELSPEGAPAGEKFQSAQVSFQ